MPGPQSDGRIRRIGWTDGSRGGPSAVWNGEAPEPVLKDPALKDMPRSALSLFASIRFDSP